jgi:hypothetical protein
MYPYLYTQFSRKNNMSITKDEMVAALKEASRAGYFSGMGGGSGGFSGGGGSSSSSSSGEDWGKKLTGAADAASNMGMAALGAGSKIAEGGARMSDATDALSKGFAGLGANGSILGTALEKGSKGLAALGQNIDQNVDTWRKLSDTGLAFGNDIMAMKDQASNARLSIGEMSEVLQKNNSAMLGFGATSAESAKKLSAMSNEFFASGLGEQLRGMGYTTKELNDVMAVSISGSRIKDLNDKASQDRALKSAASLATEMDAVAKITGQSKQDQLDELRRKATDGQRMAAIDEAIARGGEGAKEAFDAITTNGKLMGPQFQKLAEDMASMGRPSEGMEAAYGLLSSGAKTLMSEAGEAARAGNRERAAELTKQAAAEQAAFQQTSQYRTMAAQAGIKETQDSYAQGAKFRNALEQAGKELGPMAGSSEKTALALKKLEDQVKTEQQAGGKDDPNASAGASITRFAVDIENRGRDLTKAINDQVIQPLVKDIGPELRKAGKALGITTQKGEVTKEDQAKIDAEKDPKKKAALQSAAEDKKAASMVDRELGQPVKAGFDKARINRLVKEEADQPNAAGNPNNAANKDLIAFNNLIAGNQKQSDAALKVLNDMAAKENAKAKPTDKPVTGADIATRATNTPGGLAEINKAINKELGDSAGSTKPPLKPGIPAANPNETVGSSIELLGTGIESLGALFRDGKAKVQIVNGSEKASGEPRSGGTYGAGKLFEDVGSILQITKPGEVVLNGEQQMNLAKGMMDKGAASAFTNLSKNLDLSKMTSGKPAEMPKFEMPKFEMPKFEMPTMGKDKDFASLTAELSKMGKPDMSKLDLSTMSKSISTSISSVTGGKESSVKLSADDITDLTKPFKKSFAEISSGFDEFISDSSNIVKENGEQIKADITDALPVKEMAAKQQEFHSQFTESQQKIIDDYKGYSEENRSFHAQALEAGIKEDTETAQIIAKRISKMKADIGDRQATEEEQKALENEAANKAMFEQQVEKKKEMLDVMQNLGDYSAKREQELKQKSINDALADMEKQTATIKSDISAALPVDTEFGDLDGAIAKNKADDEIAAMEKQTAILQLKAAGIDVEAMEAEAEKERQAAWDSAVPEKINDEAAAPKKSIGDMMAGLTVGPNGMPIMRSIDSAKQTLTQKTPSPGKKINPDTGEEYTPVEELEKQQGKKTTTEKKSESKAAGKEATLSDVVTALNTLNTKMAQLIEVNEVGHKSTAKATKSNAGNIYAR